MKEEVFDYYFNSMQLKKIPFLFLFFFIIFEPKIAKAHRSLMRNYTSCPEFALKQIYFCLSDLIFTLTLFLFFYYSGRFLWKKDCLQDGVKLSCILFSMWVSLKLSPLYIHHYHMVFLWFWFSCFALFFLIKHAKKNEEEKSLMKSFCYSFFLVSCFQALVASLQYFAKRPIGLFFLGEDKGDFISFFALLHRIYEGFFKWVSMWGSSYVETSFYRSSGTFDHPNVLSGFLVCGIIMSFAAYSLFKERKGILVGIFLQIFALFTTFSRAGILAFFVSGFFWMLIRRKKNIAPLAAVVFFSAAFSLFSLLPEIRYRGGMINHSPVASFSNQERLFAQKASIRMIQKRPLFGVGPENFLTISLYEENNHVLLHNIYLLVFAELGLFGLILFAWLLLPIIQRGIFLIDHPFFSGIFFCVMALLFLGMFDFYPIISHKIRLLFFVLAGVLYREPFPLASLRPNRCLVEENVT